MNSSNDSSIPSEEWLATMTGITINLILGLPTNSYVLWLIASGAAGTMASEFFALNLAISEILYCLFSVLILVYQSHQALRRFMPSLAVFITAGRPLFQTCISLERYMAVVRPVVFLRYKHLRHRLACCSAVWVIQVGWCASFPFLTHQVIFNILLCEYISVISLNLFCCLSALWALKQPGPGEGERERRGRERETEREGSNIKTRAFKIILVILVFLLLTYVPWSAVIIAFQKNWQGEFRVARTTCFTITVVTGFLHPLLFLHRTGKLPFIRGL